MLINDMEVYDASELEVAKTCLFKYYCRMIRSKVSVLSDNTALHFGQALHLGVQSYLQYGDVDKASRTAQDYFAPYYKETDEKRTPHKLAVLMDAYAVVTNYQDYEVLEVEKGLIHPLKDDIMYCGRLDLIVRERYSGHVLIWDIKSTWDVLSYIVRPHDQFTGYWWLASEQLTFHGLVVDLIGVYKTKPARGVRGEWLTNKTPHDALVRYITERSPEEVERWKQDTLFYIDLLKRCAQTGIYPKNSLSCRAYQKYCDYLIVCQANPNGADRILDDPDLFTDKPWSSFAELHNEGVEQ